MIVTKSRLQVDDRTARIVATVCSEAGNFDPFELAIGVPPVYAGWLDLSGNPFVPILLLLAGELRERLRVEGPVSSHLLINARNAAELFQQWWGVTPVALEAEALGFARSREGASALFFTRGVDSWYSATRDRAREKPSRLTHLLYSADCDRQYSPATRRRALELTQEAAGCLGVPLIPISNNLSSSFALLAAIGRLCVDP